MNSQYHFNQEPSTRKAHVDQRDSFYTHDWETANDLSLPLSEEPLEGKIIAQMPDLGTSRTISEIIKSKQQAENWLNRIYSGFAFLSYFPKRAYQSLAGINFKGFRFSFPAKQTSYRNLIIFCLVVFMIGGGFLIHKSVRKQQKNSARLDVAASATPQLTNNGNIECFPCCEPATPQPAAPSEPAASPKPAEIPATPQPSTPPKPAEIPATPQPVTPPAEKPPVTTPAGNVAVTVAATDPKVAEKSNQNNVNSPWERSATDNYSPWTMNSPGRLEVSPAVLETVDVSAVAANPVPPTVTATAAATNPALPQPALSQPALPQPHTAPPLVPMMPIVPNQPEITANPLANIPVNNPVHSANAGQPVLPNSNGSKEVVAFSQQNIPVSQNYLTTYRRIDGSPVPPPMQPTPLPVYPPQTYNGNGQPEQNQYRQYEQIVPPSYSGVPTANNMITPVPMQGVAPQPVPGVLTGAMLPIPIQPVAPIPIQGTIPQPIPQGAVPQGAMPQGAMPLAGTIPQGAVPLGAVPQGAIPLGTMPPSGTMPMSQPIPIQVTAPIPQQTYHSSPVYPYSAPVPSVSSPVSPSYYPPTSAAPYYQQSNTPAPYRRLY
ncbi:MAG: hypothetical protein LBU34_01400 [Planctomycetaceae bacterium]|jgi:hypothetical protein|nr:hypothetical protein [Planctomycetaceae bacterium]